MKKNGAIFGFSTLAALLLCGRAGAAEAAKPDPRADELQALQAEVKRLAQELEAMKAKTAKAEAVPVAAQVADTSALAERLDVVEIQQKDAVVMGTCRARSGSRARASIRLYGFAELNYVHAFGPDKLGHRLRDFPLPAAERHAGGAQES